MVVGSIFLGTLALSFSVTLLVAGGFGAYYGQGRSRAVGFSFVILAVLALALVAALTFPILPGLKPVFDPLTMGRSAAAVLAGILGAVIATGTVVYAVTRG